MIKPSAAAEQAGSRSKEPPCHERDRREAQHEQSGLSRRIIAREQAEGNSPVPPQSQIEERHERPQLDAELARTRQDSHFCELVNKDDNERNDASRQARSHGKRPSALSSRSASASRGLTSGKSGDAAAGSK